MQAKIIAWGEDREVARTRLIHALEDTVLLGVASNRDYLTAVLRTDAFASGDFSTAFVGKYFPQDKLQADAPSPRQILLAAAALYQLDARALRHAHRLPAEFIGWHNSHESPTDFKLQWRDKEYDLEVLVHDGHRFTASFVGAAVGRDDSRTGPVGASPARDESAGLTIDITAAGITGDITATTVQGDVDVTGGSGHISLNSTSGSVKLAKAQGRIDIVTVNDGITVTDTKGDLSAETTNGDVELRGIDADNVSATTINGDITYDGTIKDAGHYSFSTNNGDVNVSVPQGANVAVTASTFNGDFDPCFPITLTGSHKHRFTFTMGTGSAKLEMESFGGDLKLCRPGEVGKHHNGTKDKDKDRDDDNE